MKDLEDKLATKKASTTELKVKLSDSFREGLPRRESGF